MVLIDIPEIVYICLPKVWKLQYAGMVGSKHKVDKHGHIWDLVITAADESECRDRGSDMNINPLETDSSCES